MLKNENTNMGAVTATDSKGSTGLIHTILSLGQTHTAHWLLDSGAICHVVSP